MSAEDQQPQPAPAGGDDVPAPAEPQQQVSAQETAGGQGDEVPPPAAGQDCDQQHVEQVEEIPEGAEVFRMPGELFRHLCGMGFSENAVKKSYSSGCINEDTCLQWLNMHVGHPELDTPLDASVYVKIVEKKHLTPEQLEEQVKLMKEKIAKKKIQLEEEQKQRDREAERMRVDGGKRMREAKEEREKKQRMEAYEEARKEKLRDAAARERVQIQLAVDRKVRQGMDSEAALVEATKEMEEKKAKLEEEKQKRLEEKQREREELEKRRAENGSNTGDGSGGGWNLARVLGDPEPSAGAGAGGAAPGATSSAALPPAPVPELNALVEPTQENFTKLIFQMQDQMLGGDKANDPNQLAAFNAVIKTMKTIIGNILQQPLEVKFRQLKKSTATFGQKIAPCPHAVEILMTLGFRSEQLPPAAEGQAPVDVIFLRTVVMKRLLALKESLNLFGVPG